jgi:hypothetical protein
MSEEFSEEPVVGHHVDAEIYQPPTLFENLDDPEKRVRIRVGDVDWTTTEHVSMTVETFEEMIEWYENQ